MSKACESFVKMDKNIINIRTSSFASVYRRTKSTSLRKEIDCLISQPTSKYMNPVPQSTSIAKYLAKSPVKLRRKTFLRKSMSKYTGGPSKARTLSEDNKRIVVDACITIQRFWRKRKENKQLRLRNIIRRSRRKFSGDIYTKPLKSSPLRIRKLSYRKKFSQTDRNLAQLFSLVQKKDLKKIQSSTHYMNSLVINGKNAQGNTPLYLAAKNNEFLIVKHLVLIGCRLNIPCEDKNTELHAAFATGNQHLICFLIRKGSLLDVTNANGFTPLNFASESIAQKLDLSMFKGEVMEAADIIHRLTTAFYEKRKKTVVEINVEEKDPSYLVDLNIKNHKYTPMKRYAPLYQATKYQI